MIAHGEARMLRAPVQRLMRPDRPAGEILAGPSRGLLPRNHHRPGDPLLHSYYRMQESSWPLQPVVNSYSE